MPLEYDSIDRGGCQQKILAWAEKIFLSNSGTFFQSPRLKLIKQKNKGEYTMDDLRFDPSALLIVGMLIGVVCTLL
ncbi:MAG: hypothetical protein II885_07510 [Oscillospiraceae bacterium]|nr:hypothetical protein [Oscillospiraceae bacterium]